LVVAASAFAINQFLNHRIASHAYSPHLVFRPQAAPRLSFRTLDGRPVSLADYKGKVVVVNLWGTWCLPCVAEMRTFERMYEHYRNDPAVAFVMIASEDSPAQVRAFAARYRLDMPFFLLDEPEVPLSQQFVFPSTFLFAADGRLVAAQSGAADWSDPAAIAFIDRLKDH
jgi:thiol-disulfide isomerase/thioredoxin